MVARRSADYLYFRFITELTIAVLVSRLAPRGGHQRWRSRD